MNSSSSNSTMSTTTTTLIQNVAKDAVEAVAWAVRDVNANDGWAVVPLCPSGVKQREVVQGLTAHGLMGTRMGTDSTRTLFVSRGPEPPRLLFRHLSPTTRSCLATHAGVDTFLWQNNDNADAARHGGGAGNAPDAKECLDHDLYGTMPGVDAEQWLDLLSRLFYELGGEQRFIDLHRMTVACVTPILTASDAFAEWSREPIPPAKDAKPCWPIHPVRDGKPSATQSIYQMANDGRCFVSVDMTEANYQVLHNAGLIIEPTWAALMSRSDVAISPGSPLYTALAKRLRMLAFSKPALRPDLQRAKWSRVVLDAFDIIVEAGLADGEHDFAAFNSDEIVLHAADEDDARQKAKAIESLLASEMEQWRFTCKAHRLRALESSSLPYFTGELGLDGDHKADDTAKRPRVGFERTCLFTGKVSYKCTTPEYRQHIARQAQRVSKLPALPWPDSYCLVPPTDAEFRMCDRAVAHVVSSDNTMGVCRDDILSMLGGSVPRAKEVYAYLLRDYARDVVVAKPTGDNEVLLPLGRSGLTVNEYRARAWPSIDNSGIGPKSALLPPHVRLVDTRAACDELVDHLLRTSDAVALDCEGIIHSDGKVDLAFVQLSGRDGIVYLLDMLAPEAWDFDLNRLLAVEIPRKVVHDGRGDLGVLYRRYGWFVKGFFDTQLAYAVAHGADVRRNLVGLNQVLGTLVCQNADGDEQATINQDKATMRRQLCRDHWYTHRRPPTAMMVRYAAADVRSLVSAHDHLVSMMNDDQIAQTLKLSAHRATTVCRPTKQP